MFQPDPSQRLMLVDVSAHAWLKGRIATNEEVFQVLKPRFDIINQRNQEK